jgi:hypothetical protein
MLFLPFYTIVLLCSILLCSAVICSALFLFLFLFLFCSVHRFCIVDRFSSAATCKLASGAEISYGSTWYRFSDSLHLVKLAGCDVTFRRLHVAATFAFVLCGALPTALIRQHRRGVVAVRSLLVEDIGAVGVDVACV